MNDIRANLPTATASANLPQHSTPSTSVLARLSESLAPVGVKAGTAELMACLTLVAPSGMSAEDRTAWTAVAKQTLSGIPGDLLQRGCKKARETCKFASEIVPAIIAEVGAEWHRRKKAYADEQAYAANINAPRLAKPDTVDPKQVRDLWKALASGDRETLDRLAS